MSRSQGSSLAEAIELECGTGADSGTDGTGTRNTTSRAVRWGEWGRRCLQSYTPCA